jgi:hypothetical protein
LHSTGQQVIIPADVQKAKDQHNKQYRKKVLENEKCLDGIELWASKAAVLVQIEGHECTLYWVDARGCMVGLERERIHG